MSARIYGLPSSSALASSSCFISSEKQSDFWVRNLLRCEQSFSPGGESIQQQQQQQQGKSCGSVYLRARRCCDTPDCAKGLPLKRTARGCFSTVSFNRLRPKMEGSPFFFFFSLPCCNNMKQRKFPYIEGKRKYKRGAGEEASQIQCMFQTKSNEARHLNFTPSLPSNGRTNRQDIYHLSARGGGKKKIINNNSTQQCIVGL